MRREDKQQNWTPSEGTENGGKGEMNSKITKDFDENYKENPKLDSAIGAAYAEPDHFRQTENNNVASGVNGEKYNGNYKMNEEKFHGDHNTEK